MVNLLAVSHSNDTKNTSNGHSVIVTINDRGPFVPGRVIDVSPAAARELGFSGIAQVTLDVLGVSSVN